MTVTAPEQSQVAARETVIDPSDRRAARTAGALFILTFVTAIAARILFDPVRNDVDYIVGAGADTRVFLGATGADPDSLLLTGQSLVAVYDWTFLFGPGFVAGVGNGLMLGYLMYRSGLVPRRMAMIGLVGGPLLAATGIAVMFGAFEAGGTEQGILSIPEIVWEASLGIYLLVWGFKATSPVLARTSPAR